ncbi:MAG: hypothetical protein FJZ58_01840, partial [Chlamydiae bacterium]|nr:hypothetical protein [Chlamydiota bacterium]
MVFVHPSWRQIQLQNFTSWEKLATFLDWDTSWHESVLVHPSFPLNLPLRLARKIKKNTWTDPILKQFLA